MAENEKINPSDCNHEKLRFYMSNRPVPSAEDEKKIVGHVIQMKVTCELCYCDFEFPGIPFEPLPNISTPSVNDTFQIVNLPIRPVIEKKTTIATMTVLN